MGERIVSRESERYTAEQVESEANHLYLLVGMSPSYLMLRAYAATIKAALSAEPAAQGEVIGYITADNLALLKSDDGSAFGHMTAPIYSRARSSLELPLFTAPPAQPAERVPEGWRVLQIGAVGSAYDPPNTRRAFTYDFQPGNGGAWALGKASSSAAKASAGDYIDGGLNLLKALQEQGFGVFQIEPSATPAAPAEEGDGKEGVR